jgi:hypothetical protein
VPQNAVAPITSGRGRGSWGGVRKLPSGRFQAHYRIDYKRYVAPHTFCTKRDADSFRATTRQARYDLELERDHLGSALDAMVSSVNQSDRFWPRMATGRSRHRHWGPRPGS